MPAITRIDHQEKVNQLVARFSTNHGDFEIELYHQECPKTVWNFVNLAEGKQPTESRQGPFYD
ncbi:MAG: peptidylprolyl isomerase, partial [Pseudomonadota bacterium]